MGELRAEDPRRAAIDAVLDDFHAAAAEADGARYFAHFTADAVFLGTDASERWTVDEFRAYAAAHFAEGNGWTYRPLERHVSLGAGGHTAWFDERLWNDEYGECRGTGVLRARADASGGWGIAHYNLTFPIPNDLAAELTRRIQEHGDAEP